MALVSNGQVIAPITLGDAYPRLVNPIYYPDTAIRLTDEWAVFGAVYRTQTWVATLVNKLAYAVARLPFKVYQRADAGRIEVRDHPMAQLLRRPNRLNDPFFFWLWTASTFEVYGEALWVKNRPAPGRPPSELWPLHPSNVYTKRDPETGELIYVYHVGSAQAPLQEFRQSDVVHFKGYNPDDQIRGMSRLEPLRQTLLTEDAARRASAAFWKNGARPSVFLSHPNNISAAAQKRLIAQWETRHEGVDNFGKAALLEEGITPHMVQLTAEEMQYIESRKLNREEACALYDVPPPVVHILDRATFSNITEQMRSMYRDTMAPRLALYESALDSQLRFDFDPKGDIYGEFLMDEVMRGSFEQRAVAIQAAINSGQMTPNEARALDNRPAMDGGDRLYINAAAIPLVNAEDSPPPGTTIIERPQGVKTISGVTVCNSCAGDGPLSGRGLCRSCEGKASRMLARIKESI